VHTEQPSASYARNRGLRHATGDLICFFDDDDDMFSTYLESLAAAFEANPQAKMVLCGMVVSAGQVNFSAA
jgi:glycosyltransferase involved in cell wall biosynthesis